MKKTYGGRIRLLHWCTSQAMNESLAQIGLTSAQGHIMCRLMHSKEHLRARDIEREFCLSHPTVSGILSRLEKKGFIELRPDPADKRCKRIYVLDKASEFSSLMSETIEKNESRLVDGFTPEETAQFAAYLERAIGNMGVKPPELSCKEESE